MQNFNLETLGAVVEHKFLEIVTVDQADQAQRGLPGCGHPVHRQIHGVQEKEKLMVLGNLSLLAPTIPKVFLFSQQ